MSESLHKQANYESTGDWHRMPQTPSCRRTASLAPAVAEMSQARRLMVRESGALVGLRVGSAGAVGVDPVE